MQQRLASDSGHRLRARVLAGLVFPAARRRKAELGLYALTLLAAVYVATALSGTLTGHSVLANGGEILVGFAAAGYAVAEAKRVRWSKVWLLVAAGIFLTEAATTGFLVDSLISQSDSAPWLLYALCLLAYPLLFAALVLLSREGQPPRRSHDLENAGDWLDSVIVLMAGSVAIVFVWLLPTLALSRSDLFTSMFAVCNAVGDLVLLAALSKYALRPQRALSLVSSSLVVVGLLAMLIGDALVGAQEAAGENVVGGVADAIYIIALAALAWAAYRARPEPEATREASWEKARPLRALLPFGAVLLTLGLVFLDSNVPPSSSSGALLICTMAVVLVALSRQVIAVLENGRLQAAKAAQRSEERFRSLVTNSSDAILVTNADTTISYATPSGERILKAARRDERGRIKLIDLVHPDVQSAALATITGCLETPAAEAGAEWLVKDIDGGYRHFNVTIVNLVDEPMVKGLVLTMRDVEERVRFERELERQIFYDPLTTLANRVLLRDRLEHALVRAARSGGQVAVLFIDLDDFKLVNDHFGHLVGDKLLVEVAQRLRGVVRMSDTAARLGGDEFAILMEDVAEVFQATGVAEKALTSLREPIIIDEDRLSLSGSVGIAICDGNTSAEEMLRNADIAMYSAKSSGKNGFEIFQPGMQAAIRSRLEIQADLRRGTAQKEFVVHYQPIVRMDTGQLIGLEALARWNHPTRGLLPPVDFIPMAEKTGQITALGHQVLREACRQAKLWDEIVQEDPLFTIAVNLSPRQLREPAILSLVSEALAESGLEPSRLVLEVTEMALIEDEHLTRTKLWAIKQLGIQLSIDDFGTGYSSLSRLHSFPFDYVKIAKPFIDHVAESQAKSAVARAIIGLADSLELEVVAEGIETKAQRDRLVNLGCRLGQGSYFSSPRDAHEASAFLVTARRDPRAPWADASVCRGLGSETA